MVAPRPGLEPGTYGLTEQHTLGFGSRKSMNFKAFCSSWGRVLQRPNAFRTSMVGFGGAPVQVEANQRVVSARPNADRTHRHKAAISTASGPTRTRRTCARDVVLLASNAISWLSKTRRAFARSTRDTNSAGCRLSRPNAPSTDMWPFSSSESGRRTQDAGVYCGLSQVPTFLPDSFIVMVMPWAVAWIAPV